MTPEDKNIEKKAKEIVALRNKLFILDFISKSNQSVRKECEEFGVTRNSYYNWPVPEVQWHWRCSLYPVLSCQSYKTRK